MAVCSISLYTAWQAFDTGHTTAPGSQPTESPAQSNQPATQTTSRTIPLALPVNIKSDAPQKAGASAPNLGIQPSETATANPVPASAEPDLVPDTASITPNQRPDSPKAPRAPEQAPDQISAAEAEATVPAENETLPAAEQALPRTAAQIADEQEPAALPVPEEITTTWKVKKVKAGDSLARIFSRHDLSARLLHRIVNSSNEAKELAHIKPGETLKFKLDDEGNLLELIHQKSPILSVRIVPDENGFKLARIERGLIQRTTQASGTIIDSLYESAQRVGLSDSVIMELASIFGWDVDFALEIRTGDSFSLIYEEDFLGGQKYRDGPILAAEFVNQGRVFRAIRYEDEKGHSSYFSPDGKSMQKAFLRAPVDFRRISSRFTKARWHPVLGKKRPHRGVDYAAATGTPIKAAGDGKVVFRGRKGGYGRTVIIQHGQKNTTLYAHMSKFRPSVKKGSRVRQGDVIGYVGRSGVATGPHLHYEFRINGVHRNPLTVKLPPASPIQKKYRNDFNAKSAPLLTKLDKMSRTMVAAVD
ncbi:MAG: peptidoglycan DD-metalloendopeptidase family protein [Gammaproteobacteria bacterium]|nr:peptidoglycan DD-metalloendopeptidase family protein [Gammaproteobacteria bacterium]